MKKMSKILSLLLVVVMLVSMFTGCGKKEETPGTTAPDGSTSTGGAGSTGGATTNVDTPANGGVKLNLVQTTETATVDPALCYSMDAMQMINLTNQGLMTFNSEGLVDYGLADSYEISPDGCTYTFHIRDAVWTNGAKVTSNDFLYSWRRLTDPATGSVYAYMLYTLGVLNALDCALGNKDVSELGISAPDAETFVVQLDGPRPYFLYLIAMASYFMAVNEEYCTAQGDNFGVDIDHYIACGPYVFSDWQVGGTSVTLVKNPQYWDAANVTCDELTFTIITDAAQMMMKWDKGEVDYIGLSGDYVQMYIDDPACNINDMAAMYFISFNLSDPTISNTKLRQALSLGLDKQTIVDSLLNNGSLVADYIIPDTFAVDDNGVDYRDRIGNPVYNCQDKSAAVALYNEALAELGVSSLTLKLLYSEDMSANILEFIQSDWQNTFPGLTVELERTTYNNRLSLMGEHNYQIGFTRWYADYQDALTYLDMWIPSSSLNYGCYDNQEYTDLYYQVTGELALDSAAREAAMKKMEALILGDAAILPVYQLASCSLANPAYKWVKNVAGVIQYPYVSMK